jgi:hypothetical protein
VTPSEPFKTAELREALRAAANYRPDPDQAPVVLSLPFEGSWRAARTPARRVPSHGTHFLGQTFAIDFVAVDERWRTADVRDWRTVAATEPAERFFAFGAPVLAPADGLVVAAHDGEPDHAARRAPAPLLAYALTQASRLRQGFGAVGGNYLIVRLAESDRFVLLAHLQEGSLRVSVGDPVERRQPVAACGNSGNSTQPHLHMHVMDSLELLSARGVPMVFRDYLAWRRKESEPRWVSEGIPAPDSESRLRRHRAVGMHNQQPGTLRQFTLA